MKPYFVIALPVEGEIQVGDWAIATSKYTMTQKCHSISILNKPGHPYDGMLLCYWNKSNQHASPMAHCKKAKLYLCSRDIQVGDEVKWITGNGEIATSTVTDINNAIDVFKVIAEVSSGAKWVKPGNEFDEEECMAVASEIGMMVPVASYLKHGANADVRINILCPHCEIFH